MEIFSWFGSLFSRKKKTEEFPPLPPMDSPLPPAPTNYSSPMGNVSPDQSKMDLVVARVDSMRLQYETMNERVLQIEKMVKELLDMARSP